ncbi:MAG: hypothetical protein H6590_06750 [Flavobacteriales bacterium]|nr:hypothetical protein [Flavobacteriales bacterium]HPF90662.1 hypothetical protein [Flavobacteriales bacterium]
MIRPVILFTALLLSGLAGAQRNLEIGLATGVTHYYGDLGNIDGPVQWNSARPGMQVTFRDFLNNKKRYVTRSLTTEVRLSWFRIGYDETAPMRNVPTTELKNFRRGLSFRNDLIGASGHLVLNAYREPYTPLFQQRFFMFFHLGLGIYHGRPKADLFRGTVDPENRYYFWSDGTIRDAPRGTPNAAVIERDGKYETDLGSWLTETSRTDKSLGDPRKYKPWHVGVPLGVGLRYMLTKQLSIGVEYCYYMFMTDELDDVSDLYSTYEQIDALYESERDRTLARYISDPTGWGTVGDNDDIKTSRRGNPGLLDSFSYFSLEVSYKFKRRPGRRTYMRL